MRRLPIHLLLAATLLLAAGPAAAAGIRLLAADDRGVTLQASAGAWSISAPDADGRVAVRPGGDGYTLGEPGRALLPAWSTWIGLPSDAHPTFRIVGAGAPIQRDGVRVVIAGKPAFRAEPGRSLVSPGDAEAVLDDVTPIADGPWPLEPVVLGKILSFRGRRMVSLEVRPFRYDEEAARLSVTPTLTVRVDFNRPGGAAGLSPPAGPDPGMDAALATGVLNFEQARPWRASPVPALPARLQPVGAAALPFDDDQPEVRVRVDSTALYALPFEKLAAAGYPAGVPIGQVSVHRHEFVEGGSPPYATVDVPVELEDADHDGFFGPGDRIFMYAQNWSDRARPTQYQRWWGDADQVFVTLRLSGGARAAARDGWRGAVNPALLASYPLRTHYERNNADMMPFVPTSRDTTFDVFHWTPYQYYYLRPDTILVDVNDLDTSRSAAFKLNWVGRKFNQHFLWAALHSGSGALTTLADSLSFYGKASYTDTAGTFGSALTNGNGNAIRLWGKPLPGPPAVGTNYFDNVAFNWFEATYWRRFRAVADVLPFNSADGAGEVQVRLDGFAGDSVRVYDVTDPANPVRVLLDETHIVRGGPALQIDVQDSVASGQRHEYIAATVPASGDFSRGPRVPADASFQPVTRRALYAAGGADYLLIVPEAFLPAVAPLVQLRTSQGLRVVVAPAEAVYDEFNGGRHSGAAVQRFIRYAYQNWSSRFVLLFGDGSLDAQHFNFASGLDWIPILPTTGPVTDGSEGVELVPSDNLYAFLTGESDPINGIGGDVVPEMMVGRLPANSLADAQAMVAKLVKYEDLSGDNTWRRHLLLCSDDAYSTQSFFSGGVNTVGYCHKDYEEAFAGLNRLFERIVTQDAGLTQMNPEQFNLSVYLAGEHTDVTSNGLCRPDVNQTSQRCHSIVTPQLFASLNAGALVWNYQGHANAGLLAHENLYVNYNDDVGSDDKYRFANDDRPTFFAAFSCHANNFASPQAGPGTRPGGCLGEDMVTLARRGSIASWASVCFEVVPRDSFTHVNIELARRLFSNPPVDEFVPGDRGARVVLGEAIQSTFLKYVHDARSYVSERGIAVSYVLLGDPATRISIGKPESIVRANDTLVTDGIAVRLHTPGDTLNLSADLVSTVRLDSVGLYRDDGAGGVVVPPAEFTLDPAFPDTAGGGVGGGRRFHLVYRAHLPAHGVTFTFHTLDRDRLQTTFVAPFPLDGTLFADGLPIHDGDDVSPTAALALHLASPKPLTPAADLSLLVNGVPTAFVADSALTDHSGREWIVSWAHPALPKDDYNVTLTVQGDGTLTRRFKVSTAGGELRLAGLLAFPNPFDNDGTNFSFRLVGGDPADVKISIFTVSGRLVYSTVVPGLQPGYHQIPWDGRDAEGSALANGTYFYRLSAATGRGAHVQQLSRLVKLRKPRHFDLNATP